MKISGAGSGDDVSRVPEVERRLEPLQVISTVIVKDSSSATRAGHCSTCLPDLKKPDSWRANGRGHSVGTSHVL